MLEKLFSSKTRVRLLDLFFRNPGQEYYLRELQRLCGVEIRSIQYELENLENLNLVVSRKAGNLKYFRIKEDHIFAKELRDIFLKAAGWEVLLRTRLGAVPGIEEAFIFGQAAVKDRNPADGISLVVIGTADSSLLESAVFDVEKTTGVTVDCTITGREEWEDELKAQNPFIRDVLSSPRKTLILRTPLSSKGQSS